MRMHCSELPYRATPEFFALADRVIAAQRTLLGYDALYVLWQAVRNAASVTGAVVEIGTFRGGSAYFLASAFSALSGVDIPMHACDTFEGHPAEAITDHDHHHKAGFFRETSVEDVRAYLAPFGVRVHQGEITTTLPLLDETSYRLVHIDTDLYQPTLACLEYFGRRMSPHGVIVVDDYGAPKCPGVPRAVSEYLGRADLFDVWDLRTEQVVLVKR